MKTVVKIALLAIVMSITLSCNKDAGRLVDSTEFQGQEINNIDVGSAFEVRIIKTDSQSDNRIELRVGEKLMPKLETSLVNGSLSIGLENNSSFNMKDKLFVDIHTNAFSTVDGSGATDFTIMNAFEHKSTLTLSLSGASTLRYADPINIESDVIIDASGASKFILGSINTKANISFDLSGASSTEMSAGVASFVNADLSGSSELDINQLNATTGFKYTLSGASDMNIRSGECKSSNCKLECSGSSSYRASGFVVDAMTVELSGSSDASVNVLGIISIDPDDMKDLEWVDNPDTSFRPL